MALPPVTWLAIGSAPELVFCAPGQQVVRRLAPGDLEPCARALSPDRQNLPRRVEWPPATRNSWCAGSAHGEILAGLPADVLGLPGWSPAVPARPHEPRLVSDDHQLRPVPRSQLQHRAADVGLGGGRADIEPSGDLGVRQSFPD